MKGISTVIATLLMLLITIALAGMAYMYISGIFSRETQGIEITDSWCDTAGTVTLKIRNLGTRAVAIGGITVSQTSPTGDVANPLTCCTAAIDPGAIGTYTDTPCAGTGSRNCVYRLTPPMGRTVETIVSCL